MKLPNSLPVTARSRPRTPRNARPWPGPTFTGALTAPPPRQVDEDVLERRLAERDLRDDGAGVGHRGEHRRERGTGLAVAAHPQVRGGRGLAGQVLDARDAAQLTQPPHEHVHVGAGDREIDGGLAGQGRHERGRRVQREQLAVVDDADAVGELGRLVHVVRREHHRDAGRRELGDAVVHEEAGLRVEPRRRLVEEEHLGVVHQAARDDQALGLATGELVGVGLRLLREPHPIEQLVGQPTALRPRDPW